MYTKDSQVCVMMEWRLKPEIGNILFDCNIHC